MTANNKKHLELNFNLIIKKKFEIVDGYAEIPLLNNDTFVAVMVDEGIEVSNLANSPLLKWKVFEEIERLFIEKGPKVQKGNAMHYKLGESGLPKDSIEGRVAEKVYYKEEGDSVFRRISPITGILRWAGICKSIPDSGYIKLVEYLQKKLYLK